MKSTKCPRVSNTFKAIDGRRRFLVKTAGLASCFAALDAYGSDVEPSAGKVTTLQNQKRRLFRKVVQVAMVVNDVEASVRRYWDDLGIGPWKLYTLDPSNTSNVTFHGKPVQHSFRAALTDIEDMEWELIQPLDNRSVYAEHLSKHGEGLHHVAFDVEDFDQVTRELESKGYEKVQSGRPWGIETYVYFNLNRGLACTAELNSNQTGPMPPPDSTYP
jgi:methylmalonyl-CoA/ethylmalonyl-CoA epimerase